MISGNGADGARDAVAGRRRPVPLDQADGDSELARLVHRLLVLLGEEPGRAGLLETPYRVAKSLRWLVGRKG